MPPIVGSFDPNPETATKETKHGLIIVDAIDADLLKSVYVNSGYARRYSHFEKGRSVYLKIHRVIAERMTGAPIPKDMVVDHINHNRLDNRRANLRLCSHIKNMQNQAKRLDNKSGFKGVVWHKSTGKWQAQIQNSGKKVHLGLYLTPEQAHAAYVAAARELHGDFANDGNGCLILETQGE